MDRRFTSNMQARPYHKTTIRAYGFLNLAAGGELVMTLLSIAGWITLLLKFAVI